MKRLLVLTASILMSAFLFAGQASAQQFDSGIPAGWTCSGNCGTAGADGVVTLAPSGGTAYGWVSSNGGVTMGGLGLVGISWEKWFRWMLPVQIYFFFLALILLIPPFLFGYE